MTGTITALRDAVQIVGEWTEGYLEQPTEEQVEHAARALVEHVGGYGQELTEDLSDAFDLDAALMARGYADAELLRRAIETSGLSARRFAVEVLIRDERTVRRWLAGDSPLPHAVREKLTAIATDPPHGG